jgi:hypothetical protein
MPWLNHPGYGPVRRRVVDLLKRNLLVFRRTSIVIFLGGGKDSLTRDRIAAFVRRRRPDILVFYAEDVWNELAEHQRKTNALEMEDGLARLADAVILVCESPGTFAELGAFSLSTAVRRKLLPILDARYRRDESFINSGPLRWCDRDSSLKPAIHADLGSVLLAASDLEERLSRLAPPRGSRLQKTTFETNSKHRLLLACDLVALVGPATSSHIHYYLSEIITSEIDSRETQQLLGLAVALQLIRRRRLGQDTFFFQPDGVRSIQAQSKPSGRYRIDFSAERARVLAFMQRHTRALEALAFLKEGSSAP